MAQTFTITAASKAVAIGTRITIPSYNDAPMNQPGVQSMKFRCRFVNSAGSATLEAQLVRRSDLKVMARIQATVALPGTARRSDVAGTGGEYLASTTWEDSGNCTLDVGGAEDGISDWHLSAPVVGNVDANNQLYVEVFPLRTT